MPTNVAEEICHEAYRLFRRAAEYVMEAQSGKSECVMPARQLLRSVQEWATPETWYQMWWEARQLLDDTALSPESEEDE